MPLQNSIKTNELDYMTKNEKIYNFNKYSLLIV